MAQPSEKDRAFLPRRNEKIFIGSKWDTELVSRKKSDSETTLTLAFCIKRS